jgi:hypothetical protein
MSARHARLIVAGSFAATIFVSVPTIPAELSPSARPLFRNAIVNAADCMVCARDVASKRENRMNSASQFTKTSRCMFSSFCLPVLVPIFAMSSNSCSAVSGAAWSPRARSTATAAWTRPSMCVSVWKTSLRAVARLSSAHSAMSTMSPCVGKDAASGASGAPAANGMAVTVGQRSDGAVARGVLSGGADGGVEISGVRWRVLGGAQARR